MAANETLAVWEAIAGAPPSSAAATFDVRNGHVVLDFDADTNESIRFASVLPKHYSGGNIQCRLHWMATSATSGNVRWSAAVERLEEDRRERRRLANALRVAIQQMGSQIDSETTESHAKSP